MRREERTLRARRDCGLSFPGEAEGLHQQLPWASFRPLPRGKGPSKGPTVTEEGRQQGLEWGGARWKGPSDRTVAAPTASGSQAALAQPHAPLLPASSQGMEPG